MISIEKVSNGFVVRVEEGEEESVIVFQKEYNSMNVALAAVFQYLQEHWQDDEAVKIKMDVGP